MDRMFPGIVVLDALEDVGSSPAGLLDIR